MSGQAHDNMTAAQHDGIHRIDLSMAVTSGAGCGKTFVLSRRYLQVLLDDGQPDAPSRVVAVTFTEKATASGVSVNSTITGVPACENLKAL